MVDKPMFERKNVIVTGGLVYRSHLCDRLGKKRMSFALTIYHEFRVER